MTKSEAFKIIWDYVDLSDQLNFHLLDTKSSTKQVYKAIKRLEENNKDINKNYNYSDNKMELSNQLGQAFDIIKEALELK